VAASPIETKLLAALRDVKRNRRMYGWDLDDGIEIVVNEKIGRPSLFRRGVELFPFRGACDVEVCVGAQALAAGYRIDVVVVMRTEASPWWSIIAVECDGHDFHERTPQQASRDRARDREIFARCGIVPVRFTGSEIHRRSEQCAHEILDLALVDQGRLSANALFALDTTRAHLAEVDFDDAIAGALSGLG
jgi:very-short-patch-repair endonuclease